tara:strand:+ start:714 stop:914 length:201 start_codon:yes stop_codon:yes gene_type:complete
MSIEPMTTNLYEQINEALKPIYLTQDEYDYLEIAVDHAQDELVSDIDPLELLDRLENIVLTEQEDD